jgi:hypothetical protein
VLDRIPTREKVKSVKSWNAQNSELWTIADRLRDTMQVICFLEAWRHYLVYGWVPAQCVITTFDLNSSRRTSLEHSIGVDDVFYQPPHRLLACSRDGAIADDLVDALRESHI